MTNKGIGEYDRNLSPQVRKGTSQPGQPTPEAPDPAIVARVAELLTRYDDESVPITRSPLEELRGDVLQLNIDEGAGLFGPYARSSYYAIEAGARESLPSGVKQVLKRLAGPGAAERFERAWRRWRARIGREAIEAAERKLFPAGPGYPMGP